MKKYILLFTITIILATAATLFVGKWGIGFFGPSTPAQIQPFPPVLQNPGNGAKDIVMADLNLKWIEPKDPVPGPQKELNYKWFIRDSEGKTVWDRGWRVNDNLHDQKKCKTLPQDPMAWTCTEIKVPENILKPGKTYFWKVEAGDGKIGSGWSEEFSFTTQELELILDKIDLDTGTRYFKWKYNTTEAKEINYLDFVELYISEKKGDLGKIIMTCWSIEFKDDNCSDIFADVYPEMSAKPYYYTLKLTFEKKEIKSNQLEVKPNVEPDSFKLELKPRGVYEQSIVLKINEMINFSSWIDDNNDEEQYIIYRSIAQNKLGNEVKRIKAKSTDKYFIQDNNIEPEKTYYYTVIPTYKTSSGTERLPASEQLEVKIPKKVEENVKLSVKTKNDEFQFQWNLLEEFTKEENIDIRAEIYPFNNRNDIFNGNSQELFRSFIEDKSATVKKDSYFYDNLKDKKFAQLFIIKYNTKTGFSEMIGKSNKVTLTNN